MNSCCCVVVLVSLSWVILLSSQRFDVLERLVTLEDHGGHHNTPYDLTAYHEGYDMMGFIA